MWPNSQLFAEPERPYPTANKSILLPLCVVNANPVQVKMHEIKRGVNGGCCTSARVILEIEFTENQASAAYNPEIIGASTLK